MDQSAVINLIGTAKTQDDTGVWRQSKTTRTVMCQVASITRAEFFNAGRNGLNPEYVFSMFYGDYCGESIVEYEGYTYSVYRTFKRRTDTIELYVGRKGGTNTAVVNPNEG